MQPGVSRLIRIGVKMTQWALHRVAPVETT